MILVLKTVFLGVTGHESAIQMDPVYCFGKGREEKVKALETKVKKKNKVLRY